MTELPWEEILELLRRQDKEVIRSIYKDVFPKVLKYIQKNSGDRQSAEDVFQETLIVLYRNVQKADFQISTSVTQYVFAVSKYIWIKKFKKSPQGRGTFSLDEARIYEEVGEHLNFENERQTLMREKIELLSDDCIRVLNYFFEGFSMKEIASKMGYGTTEYARKRKYKCKEKLISLMKSDPRYQELRDDE